MKSIKLNYSIEIESIEKKLLRVTLFARDLPELEVLHLFKSKAKVENFNSFLPMKADANFIHLKTDKKDSILLDYMVKIEEPSKFGLLGNIDKDTLSFVGEQVFLMPYQAINLGKNEENLKFEITVDYSLNSYSTKIIPFEIDSKTSINTNDWYDIFKFIKSSYVFTSKLFKTSHKKLNIFSSKDTEELILTNIKYVYDYFCELFSFEADIDFCVLPGNIRKFSGASSSKISATFSLNDNRDFKLLTKRIFAAFMQTKLKSPKLFAPPNLWIIEGLSVYYASKALIALDDESKKKFNLSFDNEFKRIYRLYFHSLAKNERLFNFPISLDGAVKSFALIEYMYNIKAPLLIKLFEDNAVKAGDNILNHLCKLENQDDFSQPIMFDEVLGPKLHSMAKNFIFDAQKITLDIDVTGDLNEIKTQIAEFDSTMAMYFRIDRLHMGNQPKDPSKQENIKEEVAATK